MDALREKAAEIKEANENAIIDLKTGIDKAVDDIRSAFGAIRDDYR